MASEAAVLLGSVMQVPVTTPDTYVGAGDGRSAEQARQPEGVSGISCLGP